MKAGSFSLVRFSRCAAVLSVLVTGACSGDASDLTGPISAQGSALFGQGNSGNGGQTNSGGGSPTTTGGAVTRIAVPANLKVIPNVASATLSWDAVAGAIEYQVIIQCVGCTERSQKVVTTSATFTGLANGVYSAKIRAIAYNPLNTSQDNSSLWSNGAETFTINVPAPEATPPADVTGPVIGAPVIVGTLGLNGWYTSAVSITWATNDPESGIASTDGCAVSVTSDIASQSFTCSATNGAGLTSTSAAVTIKRDANVPVVAFASNAGSYTVDQSISISCAASDAMSGVASPTCLGLASDAYLLTIGSHTLSASAADRAGNIGNNTTRFSVTVTYAATCNLVKRWVSNAGIANSLCVKLDNAARAEARGNLQAKAGSLGAFMNEVRAQTGKFIPLDKAPYLLRFASAL